MMILNITCLFSVRHGTGLWGIDENYKQEIELHFQDHVTVEVAEQTLVGPELSV